MKQRKIILSVLTSLALITACQPVVQLSPKSPLLQSEGTSSESATTIKGKVEFPTNSPLLLPSLTKRGVGGEFSSKASITDIATSATVALIYPSDHPTNPNVTIATGLTDSNGNFIINPSASFSPALNSVYVLEASKRLVSNGNVVLTVRTLIHWSGSSWDSITTPGIYINTKTTALSIISGQRSNDLPSLQTIGKMPVVNGATTITNITGTPITADLINKVEYLVRGVLNNNGDPVHYISYVNGGFDIVNPSQINTGKIFTVAGGGSGEGEPAISVGITPSKLTLDNEGNIFISDTSHNRIRKIDKATGIISTVAGDGYQNIVHPMSSIFGRYSGDGGQATSASLNNPNGVLIAGNGDIYIADTNNNRIRKVDKATGIISTIAGDGYTDSYRNGRFSGDGGQATSASLNNPSDILLDYSGNLLISDTYNNRIRKVDKNTGIISTIAGNGNLDYSGDGGQATSAGLSTSVLALDSNENLLISDTYNNRIRKVDKNTRIISTIAGDGYKIYLNGSYTGRYTGDGGQAISASLDKPIGLSIDSNDNIYISDLDNNRIRKVDKATGIISTIAGDGYKNAIFGRYAGDGGQGTSASFWGPSGLATDNNGNVYIVDKNNYRIRKVDKSTGIISTIAGNGTFGCSGDGKQATSASFSGISKVAIDKSGNLLISEFSRVRKVDKVTGIISTVAGNTANSSMNGGYDAAGDGVKATSATLISSRGIVIDSVGNIYIAEEFFFRIRKVDIITGIISTIAGGVSPTYSGDGGQATSASLNGPNGLAIDSNDNIYIADSNNNRIRKVDKSTGIISTVAGNGIRAYSGDGGQATSASLSQPSGIDLDSAGNIYIADNWNNRIRKVDKVTGIISTVAGNGSSGYSGDGGQATSASLNNLSGIALDGTGNIYITDGWDHRIRKIDKTTGIINTIGGDGYKYLEGFFSLGRYSGDGSQAESASLNMPSGLAIDNNGDIYIADSNNNRIRKIVQN